MMGGRCSGWSWWWLVMMVVDCSSCWLVILKGGGRCGGWSW